MQGPLRRCGGVLIHAPVAASGGVAAGCFYGEMMNEQQRTDLSRLLALLLRHRGSEHGLVLDAEGFVGVEDLLAVIQRRRGWAWVRREHLDDIIATQQKRRYEIVGDAIRAIYGHSVSAAVAYPVVTPPAVLFHGTPRRSVAAILREGLKPMGRQYVHMTDQEALARLTGQRRDAAPAILLIAADRAHASGVVFFLADDGVFLAKHIPAAYVSEQTPDA